MGQAEHIGGETIVVVETHDHLFRHGRAEQLPRGRKRLGAPQIDEHHMATR